MGVSADMFEEFIFPYQLPLLERFGLNCYGCCEPMDPRWQVIKRIPRLRRVSISPWCGQGEDGGGPGQGLHHVPQAQPGAAGADPSWTRTRSAPSLRDDLEKTKGCVVELIMKDNHTLGGNPRNATQWCRIAREELGRL